MSDHKVRQVTIKKCKLLIDKKIGDKERLEQMQMKVARGLPLLVTNQAYLDGLVLKNLSEDEIQSIKKKESNQQYLKNQTLRSMKHFTVFVVVM